MGFFSRKFTVLAAQCALMLGSAALASAQETVLTWDLATTSAASRWAAPERYVLYRGAEAVQGLPGFGNNALAALYGEYLPFFDKAENGSQSVVGTVIATASAADSVAAGLAETARRLMKAATALFDSSAAWSFSDSPTPPIRVWASRETLYFDPALWEEKASRPFPLFASRFSGLPSYFFVAASQPRAAAPVGLPAGANAAAEWSFIIAYPDFIDETTAGLFRAVFLDAFAEAAIRAALAADASFPAFIETSVEK